MSFKKVATRFKNLIIFFYAVILYRPHALAARDDTLFTFYYPM